MTRLLSHPLFLLLGTGLALGAIAPLGKLALAAGFDPFLWVALFLLVSGLVLAALANQENWRRRDLLVFGLLAGLFANVLPNSMLLLAIPHVGSGLGSLMFALSPVVTATISMLLHVRPPSRPLLLAVGLGFAGAVLIVGGRNSLSLPGAPSWLLLALLMPLSLAIGNVYRTAFWPVGATPQLVGAASNLLSVPQLLLLALLHGGLDFAPLASHWPLALAQWGASIAMYLLFFRLQWVGGPTYLSQIGYVAAAIGLAIGALVLGESYPPMVWAGAALILAGIGAVLRDRTAVKPQ